MKLCSKLSALGAVLVLSTAFASADTLYLASYGQLNGSGGNNNGPLGVIAPPAFAVPNGFANLTPVLPPSGETTNLTVSMRWELRAGSLMTRPDRSRAHSSTLRMAITSSPPVLISERRLLLATRTAPSR